ncbi:toxin Cry1Ac domain D-VI-related protein [Listeria cornellensis]|uniref:Pesticidal crystal protein Cry1Aa domain-containing protein n=1 Tax=Listeria cornellensis FSL F6-0969 TaxID=1265820 RepID=W7C2F9_9LIST|nr:toxin Cry1Ac domain D-VI-related protein [Listeria cornellensis]EUJ31415.1 hypothetical protein PCORN_05136 [Listeria cornellensis FSL F6-0969]
MRNRNLSGGFIQLRTLNSAFWGENSYQNSTIIKLPLTPTGNGVNLTEFGQGIYNLFSDDTFETLQVEITQKNIDLARTQMPETPESVEKTRLIELLNKAEQLLNPDNTEQKDAVYAAINNFYEEENSQLAILKKYNRSTKNRQRSSVNKHN